MACNHRNEACHRFCATCGNQLDRKSCFCGAINEQLNQFCVMCGQSFAAPRSGGNSPDSPGKYSLKKLMDRVHSSSEQEASVDVTPVSQDDIDKLYK